MTGVKKRLYKPEIEESAISRAYKEFCARCLHAPRVHFESTIWMGDAEWELERPEDFFQLYRRGVSGARIRHFTTADSFEFWTDGGIGELTLQMQSLRDVESVLAMLETAPRPPLTDVLGSRTQNLTIFVGHGRNQQWHQLVNHLRDLHKFRVVSYESLSTAGQPACEVLDTAAATASFAILIHTAEIQTVNGMWLAAPNVVHETGFFGAHLGRTKAIILREDKCQLFSNVAGLTLLRFPDGNIREVLGDLAAVLDRHLT